MRSVAADERGFVLTAEFMLLMVLFVIGIFYAQDCWFVETRLQHAAHIKNEYLNRIRVEGCLTAEDYDAMVADLSDAGFDLLSYSAPTAPVTRDVANPANSEVWLSITLQFKEKPFVIGGLLGMVNSSFTPTFAGRELSEYVGT